jgi:hypothetical protein
MIVGLRCTRGHAGRRETFCAAFASGQKAYVISRFETLVWRPLWNVTQLWPNTILFGRMSDDDTAKSEFSMSPWQVWPALAEWQAIVPTSTCPAASFEVTHAYRKDTKYRDAKTDAKVQLEDYLR